MLPTTREMMTVPIRKTLAETEDLLKIHQEVQGTHPGTHQGTHPGTHQGTHPTEILPEDHHPQEEEMDLHHHRLHHHEDHPDQDPEEEVEMTTTIHPTLQMTVVMMKDPASTHQSTNIVERIRFVTPIEAGHHQFLLPTTRLIPASDKAKFP